MLQTTLHTFHIPVMGLAFSIDTPLKVARYGISSVLSLSDDTLLEQMREYYSRLNEEPFTPIDTNHEDYRARRITAYLNLLDKLVTSQIQQMRCQPFTPESDLTKYFSLLPDTSPVKVQYLEMLQLANPEKKKQAETALRAQVQPGTIDVNIMTKLDKTNYRKNGEPLPPEYSDALAALRGFANSSVAASVVFSAGMNMRLYAYLDQFTGFLPDAAGNFRKKVIIKVSDYRSALVQGKILAKKGIWVSEFRIESGLNCGGHAFATDGYLLGPILEEFKQNRQSLKQELFGMYQAALNQKDLKALITTPTQRITVQGGIGTAAEQNFLLQYYGVEATGWGTPFLLVPEATTVDAETLEKLVQARAEDLYLSPISPLGVPFNALRNTSSEAIKDYRIGRDRPGSPCTKKYLVSNTEFTSTPICTASRKYQKLKLNQLQALDLAEYQEKAQNVLAKECLCDGLANAALQVLQIGRKPDNRPVAICPGPNLAYFSGVFSLAQMVDHIYGRTNLLNQTYRPHVFLNELKMYLDYFRNLVAEQVPPITDKQQKYLQAFRQNLLQGILYYEELLPKIFTQKAAEEQMQTQLTQSKEELLLI
ncbi:nitronate monooxygenase family protein [Adhaeribacter rhizoryzae]|uniref:Uncharacterized protein n=1 Tax=Adhaeribacter rhizoryzae TaxID=2607907 RepID=A0A5M6DKN8_9BACT|nr:hypothetical protein [Adhaeribacter rhizoryzae]KAA5546760.1 hypothetical protein F0145_10510 [Adhaeribacter rhizoryzae]